MKKITIIMLMMVCTIISASAQKKYVLLAGVSNYGVADREDLNLSNTITDVKELKKVFDQQKATVSLITGKNVTPENIERKLKAIIKLAKSEDQIIFCFSGHGAPGALICYQLQPLFYENLSKILVDAKTKKVFCFIDACHSGSAVEAAEEYAGVKGANAVYCIACRANEISRENHMMGRSLFFHALYKGLRGKADFNGDKKVTLLELFKYAHNDVISRTNDSAYPQHPQLIGSSSLYDTVITKW